MLIGAGADKWADKYGRPYCRQVGEELDNTYLPLARLNRDDVHVTYGQQCFTGDDKIQDKRVRTCAEHHLPALLDRVKPEIVVLMGGATCRLADQRIRLDMHRGVPRWGSILHGAWEGWIWPSYDPGLGMRETGRMTQLLEDWTNLGRWMRGEWAPPEQEEVKKDYRLAKTAAQVSEYFNAKT